MHPSAQRVPDRVCDRSGVPAPREGIAAGCISYDTFGMWVTESHTISSQGTYQFEYINIKFINIFEMFGEHLETFQTFCIRLYILSEWHHVDKV